jgi:hypothetical protein
MHRKTGCCKLVLSWLVGYLFHWRSDNIHQTYTLNAVNWHQTVLLFAGHLSILPIAQKEQQQRNGRYCIINWVRSGKEPPWPSTILWDICAGNEEWTKHSMRAVSITAVFRICYQKNKQTNSLALSPQANYTEWATATFQRNLVSTFVDRGVSRGQRGGSPTVVNLSFLDRSRYFSFK